MEQMQLERPEDYARVCWAVMTELGNKHGADEAGIMLTLLAANWFAWYYQPEGDTEAKQHDALINYVEHAWKEVLAAKELLEEYDAAASETKH